MERTYNRLLELSEERCWELLEHHSPRVGRVGFAESYDADWPIVLPVNYVCTDGAVYFRTFEGSKLFAALRGQRFALEIDDVDEEVCHGWSVVVLGPLDLVQRDHPDAVTSLQSWAADRPEHVVRLTVQQISGREVMGSNQH